MPMRVYWDDSGYYWYPVQPNGLGYGPPRRVGSSDELPDWAKVAIAIIRCTDDKRFDGTGWMNGDADFMIEDSFMTRYNSRPSHLMSDKPTTEPPDGSC